MILSSETISNHLVEILKGDFIISLKDLEYYKGEEEKSIIYGLICLNEDLAFYKKNSERHNNNLKKALYNSSALCIMDFQGNVLEVNDLFKYMTGFSDDQIGMSSFDLVTSGYHGPAFYEEIWEKLKSNEIWEGEICYRKEGDSYYWTYTHFYPILDEDGLVEEIWSVSSDLTGKKRIESQLEVKNQELKKALKTKEFYIREIHHRVKNSLQLLLSIVSIQNTSNKSYSAEEIIEGVSNRIRTISSLHDALYQKTDKDTVELKEYLDNTFRSAVSTISQNINFEVIGDDINLNIESCTHLGLVFNELITNSMKHAWPEGNKENKIINITTKLNGNNCNLIYKDNGIGFQLKHDSDGLGKLLIPLLIEQQLNGSILESDDLGYKNEMTFEYDSLI
jgi:PAS domain S-box-containing protein